MPSKKRLTKTDVIETAVDLLNAEGSGALTLHRLAGELGIRPPSLYNHIDGLPGLQKELSVLNARQLADRLGDAAMRQKRTCTIHGCRPGIPLLREGKPRLIYGYVASIRDTGNARPEPDA